VIDRLVQGGDAVLAVEATAVGVPSFQPSSEGMDMETEAVSMVKVVAGTATNGDVSTVELVAPLPVPSTPPLVLEAGARYLILLRTVDDAKPGTYGAALGRWGTFVISDATAYEQCTQNPGPGVRLTEAGSTDLTTLEGMIGNALTAYAQASESRE
jgi:hypothetical protein